MDTPLKRQTLWWILFAAFIMGLGIGFFPEDSGAERAWNIFAGIVLLVLQMRWFVLDARLHGYRVSGPMFLCLVALMAPTSVFYFFATRRFAFWKSLLKSGLFFCTFCLVAGIGVVIVQALRGTLH